MFLVREGGTLVPSIGQLPLVEPIQRRYLSKIPVIIIVSIPKLHRNEFLIVKHQNFQK